MGTKTPEPILTKLGMVDYIRKTGTPSHMTTLVGIAQRGWSGQICDLSVLSFISYSGLLKDMETEIDSCVTMGERPG